ncbi:MAG: tetratricopeptide repeat protein, partial [Acidobacteriota bacterium]
MPILWSAWLALMLLAAPPSLASTGGAAPAKPATVPDGDPGREGTRPDRPVSLAELVRLGNSARKRGQIGRAIAYYREARRIAPRRYEVRLLLADTLRRAGRRGPASTEYLAAAALDPTRPEAYVGEAIVHRAVYDYDEATAVLERGLEEVAASRRPEILLGLAETRRQERRLLEARSLFERAAAGRPGWAAPRAGLARVAEDRGDLHEAVRGWDLYLELKPDDGAARARRQELREILASIAALRATSREVTSAAIFVEIGRLLTIAGDAPGASEAFGRALKIDPASEEAVRGLALALRRTGDRRRTAIQLRKLLRLRPGDPAALYALAALAREQGDPRGERWAWRRLVGLHPNDLLGARSFVEFLERAGERELLREIRRTAASIGEVGDDPESALPLLRRQVLMLLAAGREGEAVAHLYRALRLDPTDPWTIDVADEVLSLRPSILEGLAERARRSASALPHAGERDVTTILTLARLALWAGRPAEALALSRRAVQVDPGSALARSALAEALERVAHDRSAALEEARRALALDPSRLAAHVDLSLALLRAGRPAQAEAAARRGLLASPAAAPLLSLLAAALAGQS